MAISKSEPRVPSAPQLPIPKKIGRYEVIDRLATGGMAEVFVCCERGMAGLERLVVVKRILPHLAVHPQFVEMFLAEARWVARLNHPNVVQIHELGEQLDGQGGSTPYLAMEYVPGSSVRDVLIAAIEKGAATPAGAGIGLIAQACAGAHAAHELADPHGKPLGLVHRDISPHNLMVTAEGHVKLLDFGIAKATEAANLEDNTRTGALKGKVHYMAPEQCKQEALDRRADIFALGIVAWELLAQERLFKRESDLDSMQAIVTGDRKNLRKIRKDIPESVVAALEKALRTARSDRYNTADEMRRALLEAAAKAGMKTDVDAVGAFVKPLIGDVQAKRTSELITLAQERTQATPAHRATDDVTLVEKRQKPTEMVVLEQKPIEASARTTAKPRDDGPSETEMERPRNKNRKRKLAGLQAAAIGLVVVALIAGGVMVRQRFGGAPAGTPVRMVFPPVADRELIAADVAPLQLYLQDVLNRPVTISVATSYEDLLETVVSERAEIGVLPPNAYVQAKKRDPRIEILASKIIDGSTGSDGVIFVNETSKAGSIADLKGSRFCFADPLSTTGYILPRIAMRKAGIDPDKDIVSHISGTHTQVMRDIVDGVCEAGATYSGGFLAADRAGVPVARVHQLAMTGRTPQDAICATATLGAADRKRIQNALFAFDAKKAGTIGGRVERISGFSRSTDKDYDAVREFSAQ